MKIDELQTGDVLLYRSKHFLGRAIRFFTKGKVNHVSIVVYINGTVFVAESERYGFVLNRIEDSIKGREIWVKRYNAHVNQVKMSMLILSLIGKHRYDFASLLFYQVVYSITGVWIGKKDRHASKRLYCSEAVAYIYWKMFGIMKEWWKYNPKMVWDEPGFELYKLNDEAYEKVGDKGNSGTATYPAD